MGRCVGRRFFGLTSLHQQNQENALARLPPSLDPKEEWKHQRVITRRETKGGGTPPGPDDKMAEGRRVRAPWRPNRIADHHAGLWWCTFSAPSNHDRGFRGADDHQG